jgi:hypothetical protein
MHLGTDKELIRYLLGAGDGGWNNSGLFDSDATGRAPISNSFDTPDRKASAGVGEPSWGIRLGS